VSSTTDDGILHLVIEVPADRCQAGYDAAIEKLRHHHTFKGFWNKSKVPMKMLEKVGGGERGIKISAIEQIMQDTIREVLPSVALTTASFLVYSPMISVLEILRRF
jgi:FKBP-type peptidyl-prolyl cis-trans isomerase (trigger factor)